VLPWQWAHELCPIFTVNKIGESAPSAVG
jgi:hypothetical protein